jgi:hypothetical protein
VGNKRSWQEKCWKDQTNKTNGQQTDREHRAWQIYVSGSVSEEDTDFTKETPISSWPAAEIFTLPITSIPKDTSGGSREKELSVNVIQGISISFQNVLWQRGTHIHKTVIKFTWNYHQDHCHSYFQQYIDMK